MVARYPLKVHVHGILPFVHIQSSMLRVAFSVSVKRETWV